jgi:tRNA(Ile)-lysidine synthase
VTPPARRSASTNAATARAIAADVARFLARHGVLRTGGSVLVAFSGGTDSTALLWALREAAATCPSLRVRAAHLDHALDGGSAERADRARELARHLGVAWDFERVDVPAAARRGESLEAAARRLRYAFLRRVAARRGARWIATGHHRDDQVETVLLRLLFGSGITGLGGMAEVTGDLLRPLLGFSRRDLERALDELGLPAIDDPGNVDPRRPRNRLRHDVLPHLRQAPGFSSSAVVDLAAAARGAGRRLRRDLGGHLDIRTAAAGADLDLAALRALPAPLWPYGLDAHRRAAGAPWAAPRAARRELARQVDGGGDVGCDCGAGWRWRTLGGRLVLDRAPTGQVAPFSYTLPVPGEVSIPELGVTLRITESEPAPWMFRGSPTRAAMTLPLEAGQQVLTRNRRPGDRLRPFGCSHSRKLKDLLIDRRVERGRRDALPLLVVGDRIAWVPGVTIADEFRLAGPVASSGRAWVAELVPSDGRM